MPDEPTIISHATLYWFGAFAACIGIGLFTLVAFQMTSPFKMNRIGGDFSMIDTDGRPVAAKTLFGKPTAIAFGFTYCPEVCPTTLLMLTQAMKRMGREAERLNVVFVTIDPDRDTPSQLKLYLSSFDPRIRGFTGTDAEVAAMANAYHIFYQRVPTENGGYTMNHTAGVMLFDADGKIVGEIPYDQSVDEAFDKLSTLVQPNACVPGGPPRVDLWSGARLQTCGAS